MLNELDLARGMNPDAIFPDDTRMLCHGEQEQTVTRIPSLSWPSDLFSRPVIGDSGDFGCAAHE
jgi:hypothetical protein